MKTIIIGKNGELVNLTLEAMEKASLITATPSLIIDGNGIFSLLRFPKINVYDSVIFIGAPKKEEVEHAIRSNLRVLLLLAPSIEAVEVPDKVLMGKCTNLLKEPGLLKSDLIRLSNLDTLDGTEKVEKLIG